MAQMYDGALLHMSAMGSRGWEEMHRQARPPFLHPQDNGIMEIHEHNLEGVINLSTAMKKEEKAMKNSITNGNVENGGTSPSQSLHEKLSGHKRKSKCPSEPSVPQMMMMAPQQAITPQQMQHILQQQLSNPQHLQQMMQQHSMAMQQQAQHKVQEQMMQQLNEQLQINILQQSQLLQQSSGAGKKQDPKQTAVQLQQLQLQQQQLIQQIQMQQRQYFLAQGLMGLPQVPGGQGLMTPVEMQQLWKEVQAHQTAREGGPEEAKVSNSGVVMAASSPPMASLPHLPHLQSPHHTPQALVPNGLPEGGNFQIPGVLNPMVQQMTEKAIHNGSPNNHQIHNNQSKSPSTPTERASKDKTHSLYGHGVCKWPGCDTPCDDFHEFEKHIDEEHQLDDRSTAQARVQMQVVNQLELQLAKEKERLTAMMQHLHMKPNAPELCGTMKSETTPKVRPSPPQLSPEVVKLPPPPPAIPMVTSTPTLSLPTPGLAAMTLPVYTAPSTPQPLTPHCGLSTPHPLSGLPSQTPPSSGPMRRRVSDKCNLPISAEIQRNREFYKYSDVRPPFTYASLIRQGIIESPEKQLTLNEIYQWFMNTFAFFRKNQATWKNAVRHNLSLHKCFMRVENVKGAVWTVDEAEFYKRRPQKMGGNIQLKGSGDCLRAPNHYVHSLTSSMRAAMGEGAPQSASAEDSLDDECMAEDLSMSSHMSHGDLSGSADLSHAGYDEMHETEHGDASQDLVTRGSSPSMRDSVPDQPEDLRWEQHKSEPQNGNVHMIEPEDPGHHHGEPHMGYLPHEKEERREPPLPHHFNGLPVDASPPRETMVSDIGHGASMSEGTDPIKVISVQPQIHDELEDERDENEAPVHSNVLDN